MKQEDIKYIYKIDSSLDLDDVIDSLKEELKLKEGFLIYFSNSKDDLIKEKLPINKLRTKSIELSNNDEHPSLIFPNIEINVDNDIDEINILSKIKLKLNGVDIDDTIEE